MGYWLPIDTDKAQDNELIGAAKWNPLQKAVCGMHSLTPGLNVGLNAAGEITVSFSDGGALTRATEILFSNPGPYPIHYGDPLVFLSTRDAAGVPNAGLLVNNSARDALTHRQNALALGDVPVGERGKAVARGIANVRIEEDVQADGAYVFRKVTFESGTARNYWACGYGGPHLILSRSGDTALVSVNDWPDFGDSVIASNSVENNIGFSVDMAGITVNPLTVSYLSQASGGAVSWQSASTASVSFTWSELFGDTLNAIKMFALSYQGSGSFAVALSSTGVNNALAIARRMQMSVGAGLGVRLFNACTRRIVWTGGVL